MVQKKHTECSRQVVLFIFILVLVHIFHGCKSGREFDVTTVVFLYIVSCFKACGQNKNEFRWDFVIFRFCFRLENVYKIIGGSCDVL